MEEILIGTTDRSILVFIPDAASTDGSGKTGLAHTAITVSYTRVETDNDVVLTDATSSLNALTNLTDAHNDWGWKEVSSTLAPGLYRLDVADAVFATGAWYAVVYVMVTTGEASATPKAFMLVAYNPLDGVRLGLTALPNAAADAAGGLPISDAGGLDLDAKIGALTFTTANKVDATVPDTQKVDVETIKTQTVTLSGGVTIPAATLASTTNITGGTITTVTNLTNAPTAGDLTAAMKASVNAEVDTALSDYDGPTRAELTSDINSVLARLRWVVIVDGTIGATGNDTTHVHLPGLTYGNDEINGYMLVVYDVSEDEYHWRKITDWVLATELATVDALPFTPQNSTDTYALLASLADASVTGGDATAANQATIIGLLGTPADLGSGATVGDNLTDIAGSGFVSATDGLAANQVEHDATQAELAKVPKSDSNVTWNATAAAQIQSEANDALVAYDPPTNTEMVAAFTEIKGATWATTDTLEAIRDRGDAAWVTATGFSTHSAADVWVAATRTLTSAANITSTGGTTVPQTGDSFARIGATGSGLTSLAQASVATEARLAELDAANIPADLDQVKADLPSRPTKNTPLANFPFVMVDETDGFTAETGLTVTATRSLDGAAFAACANSVSEVGNGVYKINLAAGDLNADTVVLKFTATGARTRFINIVTQP